MPPPTTTTKTFPVTKLIPPHPSRSPPPRQPLGTQGRAKEMRKSFHRPFPLIGARLLYLLSRHIVAQNATTANGLCSALPLFPSLPQREEEEPHRHRPTRTRTPSSRPWSSCLPRTSSFPASPHFPPPPDVPRQMALPIRRSARGAASAARTMDLAPKENCERRRGVAEGVSVNLASRRTRRLDERDIHVEGDPDDLAAGMH